MTSRAYGLGEVFEEKCCSFVDDNTNRRFLFEIGTRWLSMRLELISILLLICTGISIVELLGSTDPLLTGLAITFAQSLTGIFQWAGMHFFPT